MKELRETNNPQQDNNGQLTRLIAVKTDGIITAAEQKWNKPWKIISAE